MLALCAAALVIGYFLAASRYARSWFQPGPYMADSELWVFFGTLAAFTWPHLLLGRGYPALLQRWIRRKTTGEPRAAITPRAE